MAHLGTSAHFKAASPTTTARRSDPPAVPNDADAVVGVRPAPYVAVGGAECTLSAAYTLPDKKNLEPWFSVPMDYEGKEQTAVGSHFDP